MSLKMFSARKKSFKIELTLNQSKEEMFIKVNQKTRYKTPNYKYPGINDSKIKINPNHGSKIY